jgi:hypothetical protein
MAEKNDHESPPSEARTFSFVLFGTLFLGLIAVGASFLTGTPLTQQLRLNPNDFLIGIIATLPLVVFLWWFSNTTLEHLVSFRRSQIKFFAEIGFTFTPTRIALMAIGAGISEELLFRGVFQSWLAGFTPVILAIVLSNILFGLLHMRTVLYAIIAGLVGAYLGALFAVTDNLLAPMVTHALYDAAALEYTRRAVKNWRTHSI